ncbi:MAG: hypothetical protein EPN45_06385 [Rhizobiaceae bacterium]|nr:MAG: hypothetical protein EPN45_06385 [Rhizobiaceae bacterium]
MRRATVLIAAAALLGSGILAANARDRFGGPPDHDPVTGYLCASTNCNVVRMPNANCICEKVNPGEQRLTRLKLACYAKTGGHWVSCPVRPRFGIMVN